MAPARPWAALALAICSAAPAPAAPVPAAPAPTAPAPTAPATTAPAGDAPAPGAGSAAAELGLADALRSRGLLFSAFFHYARVVEAGFDQPGYLAALQGTAATGESLGDEVFAPNLLRKADRGPFARLPAETRSRIDGAVALLAYRAGDLAEAEQRAAGVAPGSPAFARALLLRGLLAQRQQPERAIGFFREVLRLGGPEAPRDLAAVKELAHLDLARALYGLHRYAEASAEYASLPRFSRHWDEALFEGAYADLRQGDPGGALGKLHGLHSPHLSDELAPESENLAALVYFGNCLYPQVREAARRFETLYLPLRDRVKAALARGPALEEWPALLRGGDHLPAPVLRNLKKNERVEAMIAYLGRLDDEAVRLERASDLPQGVSRAELREIVAAQRTLAAQVTGKFVQGRLVDLVRLIDVLDREKDLLLVETAKGEKALIESNVDVRATLERQRLLRPEMPNTGHEYWPFDGEYWPDEIGYTRYTLKNACPATAKDDFR